MAWQQFDPKPSTFGLETLSHINVDGMTKSRLKSFWPLGNNKSLTICSSDKVMLSSLGGHRGNVPNLKELGIEDCGDLTNSIAEKLQGP